MIKKKYLVLILLIAVLIGIAYIFFSPEILEIIEENIRKSMYGEPINLETGEINNEYFSINAEGENPSQTAKGINNAVKYANKENIEYIKLKTGIYKISASIFIRTNMTFDLNQSEIQFAPTSATSYIMINIGNTNNVTICNGKIKGDRVEHDYETIDSTHEWGFAVYLKNANNITIENLEILDAIGDGIYILDSQNVQIGNNKIHDVRRNGITIISGDTIEIHDNEIYNINGTRPMCGIDMERNSSTQQISNVKIYGNRLHNVEGYNILTFQGVSNVEIYENEIWGEIFFKYPNETITKYDNEMKFVE